MAITSTGYQAPATSRQGLKPSVYDKIILIGPDEINYTRAYNGGAGLYSRNLRRKVKNEVEGERAPIEEDDRSSFARERMS